MDSRTHTIDHNTLANLVEAGAVRGADIVGQSGGWEVVIKYGMTERALATKRGTVRIFKRFETLVTYLKSLGITEYRVNAANYDQEAAKTHEAAAYDTWLKAKVTVSLAGIEDGSNPIIDDDTWAAERAQWQREVQAR